MQQLETRDQQEFEPPKPYSELFRQAEKQDAILAARGRLQSLFNRPDPQVMHIFAEVLGDMPPSLLVRAFNLAERTCDRMPTPSVLRRLVCCDSSEAETDAAFTWVTHYLRFHGVDGHAMSGDVVFEDGEVKGKRPDTPANSPRERSGLCLNPPT
jgi:hypothetical protein